jgi:hypothetical protein
MEKSARKIKFYNSHEEQEEERRKYYASLSPIERLIHLRKAIDLAYGMHGYKPDNLPKKHKIDITGYLD